MSDLMYEKYIKQISKYELLTAEDEVKLSKKIEQGDEGAKTTLIHCNLRLVVSIALKHRKDLALVMDLIQEGNMGLMVAATKYHYSFNTRFSTYAYPWILQYILRYLQQKTASVYVPALKADQLHNLKQAIMHLKAHLHRIPSIKEVSDYTGLSKNNILELQSYDLHVVSLQNQIDNHSDLVYEDIVADTYKTPEEKALEDDEQAGYFAIFKKLPPREEAVMSNRYRSYITGEKITLRQMSKKLGVSAEGVRQLELKARQKLKPLISEYVAQFA